MAVKTKSQLRFVAPHVRIPLARPYSAMYGSDVIAAEYCGFKAPPAPPIGLWQHGWVANKMALVQADQVFGVTLSELKSEQLWVASKRLEDFVSAQGFSNVRTIGMPIVYVGDTTVARRLHQFD